MTAREPRVLRVGRFELDSGAVLPDVRQAYHLDGTVAGDRDNLVVLFHSLTGRPDPLDWWPRLIGPGRVIDTDTHSVLCANLLGSCYGTTGLPAGTDRPPVTPRDMARLVRLLVQELGFQQVVLAAGGSLGGMVALEWAASYPSLTRTVIAFAAPAAHTAQAIGFNHIQRRAIELGQDHGLALARMAAMLTYRTAAELATRFGRERAADGRFQVQSYLSHQGEKLLRRFDQDSYLTLLGAMDAHDVGRGRGGIQNALRAFQGKLIGVGIPGDLLYPPEDVLAWTDAAGAAYREIRSLFGHDSFLLEVEQVGSILLEALEPHGWRARGQSLRDSPHQNGDCLLLAPARR
jgi:homoserine O-acetyltransferase/O-succinyltransferase